MVIDYEHFKAKLEKEKELVEKELAEVGKKNPDNPSDWEAAPGDRDISQADDNTLADSIEEYEENVAIVNTLENRYKDIKIALDKIEEGTYGICEVCGKEIEGDRLEANPSAQTCKIHKDSVL